MAKPLTRAQVAQLAESITLLLDAIRRDEVSVGTPTVHRLEGALVGLEVALGRGEDAVKALLAAGSAGSVARQSNGWR